MLKWNYRGRVPDGPTGVAGGVDGVDGGGRNMAHGVSLGRGRCVRMAVGRRESDWAVRWVGREEVRCGLWWGSILGVVRRVEVAGLCRDLKAPREKEKTWRFPRRRRRTPRGRILRRLRGSRDFFPARINV